jgi:hypothetical protein
MTWLASASCPGNDRHEASEIRRTVHRGQMLRLWWHRLSGGRAAGPGRTQDLPAVLQAVFWQGSRNLLVRIIEASLPLVRPTAARKEVSYAV